jgi:hypothetical protein
LPANPTPASLLRNGRTGFLAQGQPPRQRGGQWRPETFHRLYDLAQASRGLQAPARLDEFEIITRAGDLVDALTQEQLGLDKAIARLAPRADAQRLLQLPRLGKPTAAAILTALGERGEDRNGTQLVTRAGLDLRWFASGSRISKRPPRSHVGRAYLRYGLSHYAMRLIAHEPHGKAYSQRRKPQSPGKGAGQRARRAVCDKTLRMISRLLTAQAPSDPQKDKSSADY